jgi:L-2,4-diaminobutyric acid acetyltransferase
MESSTGQASERRGWAGGKASIPGLSFREPRASDGVAVHDLVARCPPLDANSLYCNLLQTTHFAQTGVLAESSGMAVGWVSGYVRPERADRLFIWQGAVSPEARGKRLGGRMIREILSREACRKVSAIETTVTASNVSSRSLFRRLAEELGAEFRERSGFDSEEHFGGRNPTEFLIEIGPVVLGGRANG